MLRLRLLFFGLCLFVTQLDAASWKGTYTGTVGGESLALKIEEESGKSLNGSLYDGYQSFKVTATADGNTFDGQAADPSGTVSIPVKGVLNGLSLKFTMSVAGVDISVDMEKQVAAKEQASTAPAGERDPAVTGIWEYQENRADPFGSSTYSERMVFFADGSFGSGGSSAGFSGSGGSAGSSSHKVEKIPGITWSTKNKNIYLTGTQNGQTQTEKLGRYHIENGAMLITSDNGRKVLFYKK